MILPCNSSFFAALHTTRSRHRIAELFLNHGWHLRRASWTDFEIRTPVAELIIEADRPILLHGLVAEIEVDADLILAPLKQAGVTSTAECYDVAGRLLRWEKS